MAGLLEAMQKADTGDLDEINLRIKELVCELEALKEARKVLELRLNGRRTRCKVAVMANGRSGEDLKAAIFDVIASQGPGKAEHIASKLRVRGIDTTPQAVGVTCGRSEWFEKLEDGRWTNALKNGRD